MDATTHTIYQEYLAVTLGNRDAAASLTLADAMQRTLDARTGPVAAWLRRLKAITHCAITS